MRNPILIAVVMTLIGLSASAGDASAGDATLRPPGEDGADIPRAPADGGPRRWQAKGGRSLDVRGAPSADAPVIATLDTGSVLHNRGCQRIEGRVWCGVGALRGALRGHAPADRLEPATAPDGTVPSGTDDSARRARAGDFDTQGMIPCAQERGQAMGECTADVARGDGGDAMVVVGFPNGFRRTLTFVHGEFVSASATMSGTGSDNDWSEADALHLIRVDDQRYELPADLIFGP